MRRMFDFNKSEMDGVRRMLYGAEKKIRLTNLRTKA